MGITMKSKDVNELTLAEKKKLQQDFINKHRKTFDILVVAGIVEDNTLAFLLNRSKRTISRFKNELKKEPYSELIDVLPYANKCSYFRITQKGYRACGIDRKGKNISTTALKESEDLVLRYYIQQQEDKELKNEILEFINKYIEDSLKLSDEMKEIAHLNNKNIYFKNLSSEQKEFFMTDTAAAAAMEAQIKNQFINTHTILNSKRNTKLDQAKKLNMSDIFNYISIRRIDEDKEELNIYVDYVYSDNYFSERKIGNIAESILILFEFLKVEEFRNWHTDYSVYNIEHFKPKYELDSPKKLMQIHLSIYSNKQHDKRYIKRAIMHHNRHYMTCAFANRGTGKLLIEKKRNDKKNRTYTKKVMAYQMDSYFINLFNKDLELYLFTNQGPINYQTESKNSNLNLHFNNRNTEEHDPENEDY